MYNEVKLCYIHEDWVFSGQGGRGQRVLDGAGGGGGVSSEDDGMRARHSTRGSLKYQTQNSKTKQ